MSLELAIAENTRAINALIEILTRGAVNAPVAADVEQEALREEPAPKAKRKKEAAPEAPAGEPAPEETAPSPAAGASDAPATEAAATATEPVEISYADAAAAVTNVVKVKGRDAGKALLASFGAANLKEVKPERFAEVIAAAKAVLG